MNPHFSRIVSSASESDLTSFSMIGGGLGMLRRKMWRLMK